MHDDALNPERVSHMGLSHGAVAKEHPAGAPALL